MYGHHTWAVKLEVLEDWEGLLRTVSLGLDYALEQIEMERDVVLNEMEDEEEDEEDESEEGSSRAEDSE